MTYTVKRAIAGTIFLLALSGAIGLVAQTSTAQKTTATKAAKPAQNAGEKIFMTNCGRCHQPPSTIAPHITGTLIMHMRTRARLSREDQQLLLKYLAP